MSQTNGENAYRNLTAFAHFHKRNKRKKPFSTHYGKTYIISVRFSGTVFEEHRIEFLNSILYSSKTVPGILTEMIYKLPYCVLNTSLNLVFYLL